MATAELVPQSAPPLEGKIRHPLERLRGTIRRYVVLEGLAICGIILAIWFWLGLALDYGVFKVFHFDWVQEAPWWLRATVLGGVAAGIVAVVLVLIVRRLVVEFSPAALALVLERRFPQILGDRLITSVELADLNRAEEQGYSRAMIEQTVRDAAVQLEKVPIDDVFDWGRLRRLGFWLVGLTLGLFLLIGGSYSIATRTNPVTDFGVRFKDVGAIWFERNVMLWNTIWPRNVYLELLDFPASGELRIGRDVPTTRLRVRAVRWLVADRTAPEGWRAMTWNDLSPDLTGGPIPDLPAGIDPSRSLDEIQRFITAPDSEKSLGPLPASEREPLGDLFGRLETTASQPGMSRRFRMLEIPSRVEVVTWGEKTSNETPFSLGTNQEYVGVLSDLKESVRFRARAGDYSTAVRSIVLVPPPMLTTLVRNEWRPAYIFHRPPIDGGLASLRGLRQSVADQGVSLSGPVSQFNIPAGADVELVGTLDKDLVEIKLIPMSRKGEPSAPPIAIAASADRRSFRRRFANVQSSLDFELQFTDTDGVSSRRHVLIEPIRDTPPAVNVTIDGIRKTNSGYMVTPVAMIPIAGTIADNYGIASAEYALSLVRLETSGVVGAQAIMAAASSMHFAPADLGGTLVGLATLSETARMLVAASPTPRPYQFSLKTLDEAIKSKAAADVVLAELQRRLNEAIGESPHIAQFEIKPQFEFLDLRERLPDLKVKDEQALQPRYRLKLTVNASDFNVESGPGIGTNKEPPFTVLVVSEPELLVEIANDERNQHFKMEDTIGRLKDARLRVEKVAAELPMIEAGQIATMALRAQEIQDATIKSRDATQEVLNEYSRLLREMELNRVLPRLVEKVKGEIIFPLESALRTEFIQAEEAEDAFRKQLEAGKKPSAAAVQAALDRLIDRLNRVMDAMGEIKGINDLITALRAIEKGQEQDIGAVLRKIKKEKEEELLKKLGALPG